jgi:hypothetical protein
MPKHALFGILAAFVALASGCGQSMRSGGAGTADGASLDSSVDTGPAAIFEASADSTPPANTDDASGSASADAIADAASARADATGCLASPDGAAGGDCGADSATLCDFASCPAGCCDANGLCQPGATAAACGGGGAACQTCPAGSGCFDCPPGQSCPALRSCGCTAESCPSGCCDRGYRGTCQPGTLDTACGSAGFECGDCTAGYVTNCTNCGPHTAAFAAAGQPAGTCVHQGCVYPPPCPFGCVDANGACQPGASNAQCGAGGAACADCTACGAVCTDQQCAPAGDGTLVCNEQTCPSGCCDPNEVCQPGSADEMCGKGGIQCQSCFALGALCSNNQCGGADGGPGCAWFNCNGCCDASGGCVPNNSDSQCGALGSQCTDCSALGDRCIAGACTAPDGTLACSATCLGCCDSSGTCQLGFIDTQCGQSGAPCQDCTSESPASTCDLSVSPRTCASEQTMCPATYGGCPAALQELAIPTRQGLCSTADLENAAVACAGGPSTDLCLRFSSGSVCGACLQPFLYDFTTQVGVRACAAPYLGAACGHAAGCVDDCLTQACAGCVSGYGAPCATQAQAGTCATYVGGSACVALALGGKAALCDPANYQGSFGAWLQAIGAAYCGE